MMKKSTCILSIPTLCAMILLMAQGLFGEVRATFTATVSCNVSPEVELVTGFLEFWLDDVEFEVTGLPDNEYYIVRPLGDDIHWHVSDEVFGNGAMATIFSEEALPEPVLIPNLILNLNPIPEFLRMRWGQRMMS
jgi:hypothetical protein